AIGATGQLARAGTAPTLVANATNGPAQGLPAGSSAPLLLWLKDKTPLAGPPGSTLTLENLSLTQAGAYRAVAINCFGAVTSAPALLEVFSVDAQPIVGSPGSSVLLGPVVLTSS